MSDLVGNPDDRLSRDTVQMILTRYTSQRFENVTMDQGIWTLKEARVHLQRLVVTLKVDRIKLCCKLSPILLKSLKNQSF